MLEKALGLIPGTRASSSSIAETREYVIRKSRFPTAARDNDIKERCASERAERNKAEFLNSH